MKLQDLQGEFSFYLNLFLYQTTNFFTIYETFFLGEEKAILDFVFQK